MAFLELFALNRYLVARCGLTAISQLEALLGTTSRPVTFLDESLGHVMGVFLNGMCI